MNRLFIIISIFLFASCAAEYSDVFAEGDFRLSSSKLLFKPIGKVLTVEVGGAYDWSVDTANTGAWCRVVPIYRHEGKDFVSVHVEENVGIDTRETTFDVVSKYDRKTITVSQLGSSPAILFNKEEVLHRSSTKTVIDVLVLSNIEFTITPSESWVKIEHPYVDEETPVRFSIEENKTGEVRNAFVVFNQVNGEYSTSIEIIQSDGVQEYEQGDISKLQGNRKLKISHANASSSLEGKSIELSFDGNPITHYQSEWQDINDPVVLEYHFENEESIDYIMYRPYASDSKKLFGTTEIWTKSVGEEYVKRLTHKFVGESVQTVMFEGKIMNPESVKFVVKSGSDSGEKDYLVVACAEMEFYASTVHYPNIFTDRSYSVLKEGVTLDQVLEMEDEFFRTIAEYLYHNTYPISRIRKYEAFPYPSSSTYVTKAMGLLDNATGISVIKGDTIVLMVDNLKGQQVYLTVMTPGQCGLVQRDVTLTEGITKLQIEQDGLLYVKYFTSMYETAEPVTIHIAGGKVNGIYDSQRHSEQEGVDALNRAGSRYFDLQGKYTHLIFPTEVLRTRTSSLKALVDKYDRIVELQRDFTGMTRYASDVKNRVCIMSTPNFNVVDAANVILLNENFINFYADPNELKGDILWEVTSNVARNFLVTSMKWNPAYRDLNTLYVVKEMEERDVLQEEARYETASERFVIKYENMENARQETDVDRLVPLWQLYMYMKDVVGRNEFFQELFYSLSKKFSFQLNQSTFLSEINKLSKIDFKSYFKEWSFSAYSDVPVQTLKAPVELKYICEDNIDMFKNPGVASATRCTYYNDIVVDNGISRNVQVMEVENASNIVGCEVIAMGQLAMKYGTKFTIDNYTNSTRVTAVGVNGERIVLECVKISKPRN